VEAALIEEREDSLPCPVLLPMSEEKEASSTDRCYFPMKDPYIVHFTLQKEQQRLKHCPKALTWCRFEYLYSQGDDLYFRHNEFVQLLEDMGKGHLTLLPIREWRRVRRLAGVARRFSPSFLLQERERLHAWRANSFDARRSPVSALNWNVYYLGLTVHEGEA
jgi:hypothetical protein